MTTSLDLPALIANAARAEVVPVEMVGVLLAQPRAAAADIFPEQIARGSDVPCPPTVAPAAATPTGRLAGPAEGAERGHGGPTTIAGAFVNGRKPSGGCFGMRRRRDPAQKHAPRTRGEAGDSPWVARPLEAVPEVRAA